MRNRPGFADFYHPAKTLCNFLSLLPAAEYGNLAAHGHFCNCVLQGSWVGGRSSHPAARYCLGVQRREEDAFENVSSDVSRTDGFPSLPSLCCCAVLQLKLQQRRTREELVSQGIMPREYHLNSFSFCYYACFLSRDWFHKRCERSNSPFLDEKHHREEPHPVTLNVVLRRRWYSRCGATSDTKEQSNGSKRTYTPKQLLNLIVVKSLLETMLCLKCLIFLTHADNHSFNRLPAFAVSVLVCQLCRPQRQL